MGIGLMAGPKKSKERPGPKPDPKRIRRATIMIRGTDDWKDAVEAFAEWARTPSVSDLFDRSIVAYARELGYDKPFPKR